MVIEVVAEINKGEVDNPSMDNCRRIPQGRVLCISSRFPRGLRRGEEDQ